MKTAPSPLSTLALVMFALALGASAATAQEKAPASEKDAPFAYAAPAFIKELDTEVPRPAPGPALAPPLRRRAALPRRRARLRPHGGLPSRARPGVGHADGVGGDVELPRGPAHAGDPQDPGHGLADAESVDVDLQAPTRSEVPQPPARERPRDDRRGREVLLRAPEGQGAVLHARRPREDDHGDRQVHGQVRALHARPQVLSQHRRLAVPGDRAPRGRGSARRPGREPHRHRRLHAQGVLARRRRAAREEPRLLLEGQGRSPAPLRGRGPALLHQGRRHRDGAVQDQAARRDARLHAGSALRADEDDARSPALPRLVVRLGRLRPEHGAGQGALQRRAGPSGPLDGHQPRHRVGGDQQGRRRAVRPLPLGPRGLRQALGLLLRQPRPQLPVQPPGGQEAPGRGRLSQRPRPRAGVGRVPGLELRRVRAARRTLLQRRRPAGEAEAARDVDLAGQGHGRPALHPPARHGQPHRRRPELHGLGLPALPLRRIPRP